MSTKTSRRPLTVSRIETVVMLSVRGDGHCFCHVSLLLYGVRGFFRVSPVAISMRDHSSVHSRRPRGRHPLTSAARSASLIRLIRRADNRAELAQAADQFRSARPRPRDRPAARSSGSSCRSANPARTSFSTRWLAVGNVMPSISAASPIVAGSPSVSTAERLHLRGRQIEMQPRLNRLRWRRLIEPCCRRHDRLFQCVACT